MVYAKENKRDNMNANEQSTVSEKEQPLRFIPILRVTNHSIISRVVLPGPVHLVHTPDALQT